MLRFRRHQPTVLLAASMAALGLGAFGTFLNGQARQGAPATRPAAMPAGRPVHVLFLGMDQERPHNPAKMYPYLAAPLARRGIQLTYIADQAQALDPERLKHYDVLMIYGNQTTITPAQEAALVAFVEGGKGLVAIHAASAMFTNSDKYLSLVGGHFLRHGTGEFTAQFTQTNHPVLSGLQPFLTWDETYVHDKHNTVDRTVLMERVDTQGREPWTWVRTQGQGRVFYTAYGHDERTWDKPEFKRLIENAVIWSLDATTREAFQRFEVPGVTYVDGYTVPNYERRTPAPKYQMPFEPELAQRFMQTPAEFDIQLFASEPMFLKAIAMAFDERGRLWIIESRDYPNVVYNGLAGNDKIKILEDTNGDGKADKVTTFAEKINLGSSLTFANGGVIVSAPPLMLFFKDTNGDDKADVREVLSSGWGMRDTHGQASNLQYGPDNYVWGSVGYNGGTVGGKQFLQGAFRFKPDGSDFEVMTQSTNNTWGLGFNESFDVFGSTANGDPSWYMGIPGRFFEGLTGLPTSARAGGPPAAPATLGYQSLAQFTSVHPTTPYIRQVDNMGFYTAGAGHMFYTARAFPKEYWNRIAFISEPTGHLVGQGIVEPKGAGYVTRDGWNLMSSAEEWFAPIAAQVGPDGAVWVDDWYNFIQQHNPTPTEWGFANGRGGAYETSMRDHERGRIYRVVYKGAPPQKKRSLSKSDTAGLLEALACDNMFWRLTAQRLLVERKQKDVVPQLIALVRNTSVDAIGLNGGAMHALWTLQGLGELNSTNTAAYLAAVGALKHPSAGVRKAAGRAGSLEEQALGPIENPIEMGETLPNVVRKLNAIPGYRSQFQAAFGSDATPDAIAKAIAAFERTVITGVSPYDRYLAGDKAALSPAAERGMTVFAGKGRCMTCHSGSMFSDQSFHNVGVGMNREKPDVGREAVTKNPRDRGAFKTPTLRNVALTWPYLHDGSAKTLDDVLALYNRGGEPNPNLDSLMKPLALTASETADLKAFLEALTGPQPKIAKPDLPPDAR